MKRVMRDEKWRRRRGSEVLNFIEEISGIRRNQYAAAREEMKCREIRRRIGARNWAMR